MIPIQQKGKKQKNVNFKFDELKITIFSDSESSDDSLSELDVRLKTRPSSVLRSTSKDATNGDASLIIREEKDTIPR